MLRPVVNITKPSLQAPVATTGELAVVISKVLQAVAVPRSAVSVPIAPGSSPEADTVYAPPGGGRGQYLPHYALQEVQQNGQPRYGVEFVEDATAGRWGLRVTLLKSAPAALSGSAATLDPIAHDITLSLSFSIGTEGTLRNVVFEDLEQDPASCRATWWATSLAERDSVFHAITNASAGALLTLNRSVTVAVPSAQPLLQIEAIHPGPAVENNPQLTLVTQPLTARTLTARPLTTINRPPIRIDASTAVTGLTAHIGTLSGTLSALVTMPRPEVVQTDVRKRGSGANKRTEFHFRITNINAFGAALFNLTPETMSGPNKKAPRLQLEILDADTGRRLLSDGMRVQGPPDTERFFGEFADQPPAPEAVIFRMTDTVLNRTVNSNPIAVSRTPPVVPEDMFEVVTLDFPMPIAPQPFSFDAQQHAYIFAALNSAPPADVQGGLARHRVTTDGQVHSYFQDVIRPERIYFLPDDFKIARHSGTFRPPRATVRVATVEGETGNSFVTFDYVITPHVDMARLSDAALSIAEATSQDPQALQFQPYLTNAISYSLSRPSASGRVVEQRPVSQLMLQEPIVDTLVLPVADFQIAFDAMVGKTASEITGEVALTVGEWGQETRRVKLDFRDLSGPMFDVAERAGPAGTTNVDLVNAIESNVVLDDMVVVAIRDGMMADVAGFENLQGNATLTPGEAEPVPVSFDALPGSGPVEYQCLSGGVVDPDAEAIMNAILDRAATEYFRDITVRTVPTIFADPATNPPQDGIFAIMVEFDGGQTVVLDAATPEAVVRVDFSFSDAILGQQVDDGTYRYTKTIIRMDGSQERDGQPTEASASVAFVTPFVVPGGGDGDG